VASPPGHGALHHLLARSLGKEEDPGTGPLGIAVVVHLESAVEAESRIQRVGTDKGRGGEPGLLQHLAECRYRLRQHETGVVPDAVLVGVTAGQYVGVGRKGDYVVGVGVGEDTTGGRQAIQHRCPRALVPGESERIGAQGIDRDQHQIRRLTFPALPASVTTRGGHHDQAPQECAGTEEDPRIEQRAVGTRH
jgi:hypothetical protein